MPSDDIDDNINDEIADLFDDFPSLRSVAPFLKVVQNVRWFRSLGERPSDFSRQTARDYADMLGFPEVDPVFLPDWEDAAYAAENPEVNSPAWEEEEQLRAALTTDVLLAIDESVLDMVMTHIAQTVTPVIDAAAQEVRQFLVIDDKEFVQAAAGAAAQATYQAALVGMTGAEDDHPFIKRFQLFEQGHWPIAILGTSFLIF